MRRPSFFIVGAPKCGTTALNHLLSQHPGIFMAKKEIHFFGTDLGIKQPAMTNQDYLLFFEKAEKNQVLGEASVWYLFSKTAAKEIHAFNPDAKIIISLRNPVSMLPSLHASFIVNGDETIADFEKAFQRDQDRKKRKERISCKNWIDRPGYVESVAYYDMVKRYLTVFQPENVLILLHDELINAYESTMKKIYTFLGVDNSLLIDNQIVNPNRTAKSTYLHYFTKNPPAFLQNIVRVILPLPPLRHRLMAWIQKKNVKTISRKPLNEGARKMIIQQTKDQTKQLSNLINQDLNAWIT